MPEKLLKLLIADKMMLIALLHPQERLTCLDGLVDLDMDLADHAVTRGENLVFHLHGFDDKQRVTSLERLAGRGEHLEDLTGQWGLHEIRRGGRAMEKGQNEMRRVETEGQPEGAVQQARKLPRPDSQTVPQAVYQSPARPPPRTLSH